MTPRHPRGRGKCAVHKSRPFYILAARRGSGAGRFRKLLALTIVYRAVSDRPGHSAAEKSRRAISNGSVCRNEPSTAASLPTYVHRCTYCTLISVALFHSVRRLAAIGIWDHARHATCIPGICIFTMDAAAIRRVIRDGRAVPLIFERSQKFAVISSSISRSSYCKTFG